MVKLGKSTLAVMLMLCACAVQADEGFYGSLRLGLHYIDEGQPTHPSTRFIDNGSRIGYLNSRELDTGLITFGKIEVGINTSASDSERGDAFRLQQAYAGLKGDFGSLLLGKTYHTWYNSVINPVDKPLGRACNGCISYTGRAENGLTYTRKSRRLTIGATIHMREQNEEGDFENEVDGIEIGGLFKAGSVTLGFGYQNWDIEREQVEGLAVSSESIVGASISGAFGEFGYASNVIFQEAANADQEHGLGLNLHLSFRNAYFDIGRVERGIASLGVTLGYTLEIDPGGATIWFELSGYESGIEGDDPETAARIALKYDWGLRP